MRRTARSWARPPARSQAPPDGESLVELAQAATHLIAEVVDAAGSCVSRAPSRASSVERDHDFFHPRLGVIVVRDGDAPVDHVIRARRRRAEEESNDSKHLELRNWFNGID